MCDPVSNVRSSALRRSGLLFSAFFAFSVVTSFSVQQAWVAKYNLAPTSTNQAVAIALDFNGDIVVAGHGVSGPTRYDYIILKYASVGTQVWARTYASPGAFNDQVRTMKVDGVGNIFVTGTSETVMYSGNGTPIWNQPYAGRGLAVDDEHVYVTGFSNNVFATAKLSKVNGSNVWLRTFTVLGGPEGPSEAVALHQKTNVFIAGANTCYYNPPGGVPRYVKEYTIGYTSTGAEMWRRESPEVCQYSIISTKAVVPDSVGNIYVLLNVMGLSAYDYATFKYSPSGTLLWQFYLENLGSDAGKSLGVDVNGYPYITGASLYPQNYVQFGTVKLDPNTGTNIWHRQYGGQGSHAGTSLALDSAGNIYVTGRSASPSWTSPTDIATLKYDPEGNLKWAKRFNGPANGNDEATAIAVSPSGDIYVTGFSTTASNLIEITTIKYIQVSPIEKKSNGNILLTFCGGPGSNYLIEACSTLTNWTDIGSATADGNGLCTFEDTNAALYQQRFYRAIAE